jgi:hypothetical protein
MIPQARKNDLVVQVSGDEVLVYDLLTNKARCLNRISAAVWEKCDGIRSPEEIRVDLESEFNAKVTEDLVWFALEQLNQEDLLENEDGLITRYKGISRRAVIRNIALGSAIALPMIASLAAPTALSAQSGACTLDAPGCLPNGNVNCLTDSDCCSCNCRTNGNCVT